MVFFNRITQLIAVTVLSASHLLALSVFAESGGNEAGNGPKSLETFRAGDMEKRTSRLPKSAIDKAYDVTALEGMPEKYGETLTSYTNSVLTVLGTVPMRRHRFYHRESPGDGFFPMVVRPIYDTEITIPIVILPRPTAVTAWAGSAGAKAIGWHPMDEALKKSDLVYGHAVLFQRGPESEKPITTPALPHGSSISPGIFVYTDFFLELGKVNDSPRYDARDHGNLVDLTITPLGLGKEGGAKRLADFETVPAFAGNPRLRWAAVKIGKNVRRYLAYPLVDGNGGARDRAKNGWIRNGISCFVRPLVCVLHQPRIEQHDELLLPTPNRWPATRRLAYEVHLDSTPHEDWCLDDWFPAQKDACWVIREAEDSKPLQESFLLMPASEKSDRPVFFIALFAETEPARLVKELAALYKVSPDAALNSPETMARLQSLYEKVRDFPLGK